MMGSGGRRGVRIRSRVRSEQTVAKQISDLVEIVHDLVETMQDIATMMERDYGFRSGKRGPIVSSSDGESCSRGARYGGLRKSGRSKRRIANVGAGMKKEGSKSSRASYGSRGGFSSATSFDDVFGGADDGARQDDVFEGTTQGGGNPEGTTVFDEWFGGSSPKVKPASSTRRSNGNDSFSFEPVYDELLPGFGSSPKLGSSTEERRSHEDPEPIAPLGKDSAASSNAAGTSAINDELLPGFESQPGSSSGDAKASQEPDPLMPIYDDPLPYSIPVVSSSFVDELLPGLERQSRSSSVDSKTFHELDPRMPLFDEPLQSSTIPPVSSSSADELRPGLASQPRSSVGIQSFRRPDPRISLFDEPLKTSSTPSASSAAELLSGSESKLRSSSGDATPFRQPDPRPPLFDNPLPSSIPPISSSLVDEFRPGLESQPQSSSADVKHARHPNPFMPLFDDGLPSSISHTPSLVDDLLPGFESQLQSSSRDGNAFRQPDPFMSLFDESLSSGIPPVPSPDVDGELHRGFGNEEARSFHDTRHRPAPVENDSVFGDPWRPLSGTAPTRASMDGWDQVFSAPSNPDLSTKKRQEENSEPSSRSKLPKSQRKVQANQRIADALAEIRQRELETQRERAERQRSGEFVDGEIKRWAAGKEGNLRALLSTLQYVLWPECAWTPVSLTDLIDPAAVRKTYRKAALYVHPDKVQQKGATVLQKYIAEKVFDLLKEASNKFNSQE